MEHSLTLPFFGQTLSKDWYKEISHGQFTLPRNGNELRTVNSSGDTIISLIGTVVKQANWSWTSLGVTAQGTVNMKEKEIVLEYKSSIDINSDNISVSFMDTSGAFHVAILQADKDKWIRDTITSKDLKKGYDQPDSIDYTQIKTIAFSLGGSGEGFLYDFQIKEYRIRPLSTAIVAPAVQKSQLCQIQLLNSGVLNLNHRFSSDHQLTITDLRGRELLRKTITAGAGTASIVLPMARGIYLAQISGDEFSRAWTVKQ